MPILKFTSHSIGKGEAPWQHLFKRPWWKNSKVEKAVGDRVEEDEVVVVMEAMKMEIPIVAPTSGVLKELKVSTGQAVEAEQELAVIE